MCTFQNEINYNSESFLTTAVVYRIVYEVYMCSQLNQTLGLTKYSCTLPLSKRVLYSCIYIFRIQVQYRKVQTEILKWEVYFNNALCAT